MAKREVYPPHEVTYQRVGCWVAVAALSGVSWAMAALWPSITWLAVFMTAPAVLLAWHQLSLRSTIRVAEALRRRGRKGLLVYSRSPNWEDYIADHWLPLLESRFDILDWSERRKWNKRDVRVRIFQQFIASDEDYNPAAVVFRDGRPPLVFRFYPAFKNAKHGNTQGLVALEAQFLAALEE